MLLAKPTAEERTKNREAARTILRELFPEAAYPMTDAEVDEDPAATWIESLLHGMRRGYFKAEDVGQSIMQKLAPGRMTPPWLLPMLGRYWRTPA